MADAWADLGSTAATKLVYASAAMVAVVGATAVARALREALRSAGSSNQVTLPLLTLAFSIPASGVPAGAKERRAIIPRRPAAESPPPWSGPGGSSPPLPARAGDPGVVTEPSQSDGHGSVITQPEIDGGTHPAIHRKARHKVTPLFPRAQRRTPDPEVRRREKEEAMRRHPAGKALRGEGRTSDARKDGSASVEGSARYTVQEGDTLWAIAERHLDTHDLRRIARYWPRIHRANRRLIANPDLIHPGWVLVLPPEQER